MTNAQSRMLIPDEEHIYIEEPKNETKYKFEYYSKDTDFQRQINMEHGAKKFIKP